MKNLQQYLEQPRVSVDVFAYNSKVYYVIVDGAGQGDSVTRIPISGNETVLDAMAQVKGASHLGGKNIWIVRPAAIAAGKDLILPVDWDGITRRGDQKTNYQVLPGDRIFVQGKDNQGTPAEEGSAKVRRLRRAAERTRCARPDGRFELGRKSIT